MAFNLGGSSFTSNSDKDPNRDRKRATYHCDNCGADFIRIIEIGDRKQRKWCPTKGCQSMVKPKQVTVIKSAEKAGGSTKVKMPWE